ncbi:RNA-directed DNA polymerase, eukaryota [Tanacetum coccineum]
MEEFANQLSSPQLQINSQGSVQGQLSDKLQSMQAQLQTIITLLPGPSQQPPPRQDAPPPGFHQPPQPKMKLSTWNAFTTAVELRFGPSSYDNHEAALFKLKQTSSVTEYQRLFEKICNRVSNLASSSILNCFISGMKYEIRRELKLLKPTTITEAIGQAKLIEDKLRDYKSCGSLIVQQFLPRLVPSCFAIFDLEPLSLSFDFVFTSEISKSLSFSLDRLCLLAILSLDQHAHTLHHLESLLTISLDGLNILKEDLEYQSLRKSLSLILELS